MTLVDIRDRTASRSERASAPSSITTTTHEPSQLRSALASEVIRESPSLMTDALRGVSRYPVFRPVRDGCSSRCFTMRLSAARAAASETPKSPSRLTIADDGRGSERSYQ